MLPASRLCFDLPVWPCFPNAYLGDLLFAMQPKESANSGLTRGQGRG